jgi:PAT family beta-lactamase induction signal transducer AmpG
MTTTASTTEAPAEAPKHKHPALWVPSLYFAEGLPFAVVAFVSTIFYQRRGISNEMIAFYTSLLLTPWSLKPFYSPLLEMFKTKKFFVVAMQLLAGAGMGLIALSLPLPGYLGYSLALLAIVAFFSSTHDIAADGLYLSSLTPKEISAWAGVQGACWNAGKVFATGALVYLAGKLETAFSGTTPPTPAGIVRAWVVIFFVLAALQAALGLYHSRMLPSGSVAKAVGRFLKDTSKGPLGIIVVLLTLLGMLTWASSKLTDRIGVLGAWAMMFGGVIVFVALVYRVALRVRGRIQGDPGDTVEALSDVIVTFLQKPHIYLFMAFIFLYRAGEGQINRIGPLFLLDTIEKGGLGLSPEKVGVIYGTLGSLAFMAGSLGGGYFASRLGLKRAILWLCLALNLPNIAFVYLSMAQPSNVLLVSTAMTIEQFGYGFGFVGIIVLMMLEVAPGKYQTAHYAFATALMNIGLQLPGMISGTIQQALGYRNFFIWVLLCGLPSLLMTRFLPIRSGEKSGEPAAA